MSHELLKRDFDYVHLGKVLKRFSTATLGNTEFLLAHEWDSLPKMPTLGGFAVAHTLGPKTCCNARGLLLEDKWQIVQQSQFTQQIINLLFF